MVGGGEQLRHLVVSTQTGTANPLATALLDSVQVGTSPFGVAAPSDGDDDACLLYTSDAADE